MSGYPPPMNSAAPPAYAPPLGGAIDHQQPPMYPPAGGYPPPPAVVSYPPPAVAPYPPPVAALAAPGAQEIALARDALAIALPNWQRRINAAFDGKPVPFIFNLEVLLALLPHTQSRFLALQLLVGTPPAFANCLLESLVKSVEKACCEPAVRHDFVSRIAQIDIVNLAAPTAADKAIAIHGTTLVLTVVLFSGLAGSHRTEAVADFFERTFYAEERYLTTRFMHESLPNAQKAIAATLGHDISVHLDIVAEIGKAASQAERLPCAQTLVSLSGTDRSIEETKLLVNKAVASAVRSTEVAMNGRAVTPAVTKSSVDVINSPHFLKPLVLAFQKSCGYDQGAAACISRSIASVALTCPASQFPNLNARQIFVENLPGKDSKQKSLSLAASPTMPALPASPAGQPAVQSGVLIYRMVLGAGSSGLFSEKDIEDFFELHFKAQEKGLIGQLIQQDAPAAQQALLTAFTHPVPIEFVWPSIFPDTLTPKERLTTAGALTLNHSEHCLVAMVQAFQDVLNDGPIAKGAVIPAVVKIAVQGTPGVGSASATATLHLAPLPTGGHVVVYSPALLLGIRGCLSRFDFRDRLRALFGLPKPANEKGFSASVSKVTADVNKLGISLFGSKLF